MVTGSSVIVLSRVKVQVIRVRGRVEVITPFGGIFSGNKRERDRDLLDNGFNKAILPHNPCSY